MEKRRIGKEKLRPVHVGDVLFRVVRGWLGELPSAIGTTVAGVGCWFQQ